MKILKVANLVCAIMLIVLAVHSLDEGRYLAAMIEFLIAIINAGVFIDRGE